MPASSRQERAAVRAAQAGSAAALESLYRDHWPRAYRAAYLVVHDAAGAEDIAQEAFLAAVRALDRFDRRRPFGPWLHRIVVNRAIDWARARALRAEVELGDAEAAADPPAELDAIVAALGALPPEQRAVIVLRHFLEYTPGEIADLLELPRGTVNSRLRRGLDELARARAWRVVEAAYAGREPAPRVRRPWRLAVVAVAVLAVVLAVLSPPGRAVLDSLREAIGVEHAEPALFSLPAPGRVVAAGPGGAWVVSDDGSKRRLGDFTEASWSPFGRFVVAAREHELAALEPDGTVHWTLGRPDVASPRWGGTETDTRIAYLQGRRLHAVAGDGTGDADLGLPPAARVAPAWQPAAEGRGLLLAYADARGRVRVVAPASRTTVFATAPGPVPTRLAWSSDGRRLLAVSPQGIRVYDPEGHEVLSLAASLADAAFLPDGRRIAFLRRTRAGTTVELLGGRVLYRAEGELTEIVPSPDGRHLLVAWPAADQWVFVPTAGGQVEAVANVADQLGGAFPSAGGWSTVP